MIEVWHSSHEKCRCREKVHFYFTRTSPFCPLTYSICFCSGKCTFVLFSHNRSEQLFNYSDPPVHVALRETVQAPFLFEIKIASGKVV